MGKIILYTIDCPKCRILEAKLDAKGIKYETIKDTKIMLKLGLDEMPVLLVGSTRLSFDQALFWIKQQ